MRNQATPTLERSSHTVAKEFLTQPDAKSHIVQFYEDEGFLADVVAQFLAAGLSTGDPLVVIATEPHRRAFTQRLRARGFDVEAACESGRFALLDAEQTLSHFMVGGKPNWERFQNTISAVLRNVQAATGRHSVRAYGEMVDLLWRAGNSQAAIALEEMWNHIGELHSFSLLCAYAMSNFPQESQGESFLQVCHTHSHVIPTEHYLQIEDSDARLREVSMLQQRARALEHEIQERKEVEKALREAVKARDEFLAVAGHELKTPLTALQLQVQAISLLAAKDGSARIQDRLGKATRQISRMSTLIDDLLDASRITAGRLDLQKTDVDLPTLVREAADRLADEPTSHPPGPIRILSEEPIRGQWDRIRIEQVVVNLLSNAMKYGEGKPVEVLLKRAGNRAYLVVRDHGIGVSPEDQPRIFERFERAVSSRNFGGLGLGLWIVRQVVEAHGGAIRVESALEQGATFTVELPLDVEMAAFAPSPA